MEISSSKPNVEKINTLVEEWVTDDAKKRKDVHTATENYNKHHNDPRIEREKTVDSFLEKNRKLRTEFTNATQATQNARRKSWLLHSAKKIPPLIYDEPSKVFTIDP
jgi:hypothetical protein